MKKLLWIFTVLTFAITFSATAQNPSYTIEKGDTLYSISRKYNIKLDSLKDFNNITDPSKLYPGMTILIPGGYTVQKGDTLYSIARENNTSIDEILSLNSIDQGSLLKPGQFLHVPVSAVEDNEVVEVAAQEAVTITSVDNQQWPHSGNRTELTGKLRGIQIAGNPGDDIVSVAGGTVVWAADYGIYKKLVLVEGKNGLVYGYGGNETTNVRVGDYVKPGSIIGVLGGGTNTADAFFFVYKDGKPLDPSNAPRV